MTRISEKGWNSIIADWRPAIRSGTIPQDIIDNPPTHVLDIYKMRRGRYKMIRIWCRIHLGTGYREDLFITNAANQPVSGPVDIFSSYKENVIKEP